MMLYESDRAGKRNRKKSQKLESECKREKEKEASEASTQQKKGHTGNRKVEIGSHKKSF